MWDELSKSVKASLYERVSSPLAGSFVICWLAINWEIVVVLLFVNSEKLGLPKNEYILFNLISWERGFLLPAITSLTLIIVYPYISRIAHSLWIKYSTSLKLDKREADNKITLTISESIELRLMVQDMERKFLESIQTSQDQLSDQSSLISDLEKSLKEIRGDRDQLIKDKERLIENLEKAEKRFQNENKIRVDRIDKLKNELIVLKKEVSDTNKQKNQIEKLQKQIQEFNQELMVRDNVHFFKVMVQIRRNNDQDKVEKYKLNHLDHLSKAGFIEIKQIAGIDIVSLTDKAKRFLSTTEKKNQLLYS